MQFFSLEITAHNSSASYGPKLHQYEQRKLCAVLPFCLGTVCEFELPA